MSQAEFRMATWTWPPGVLKGDWQDRHVAALKDPGPEEIAIVLLLRGWCLMLVKYGNEHQACIADDGELGPAWVAIAGALRRFVNDGKMGRLNPGIIDAIIVHNLLVAGIRAEALDR